MILGKGSFFKIWDSYKKGTWGCGQGGKDKGGQSCYSDV